MSRILLADNSEMIRLGVRSFISAHRNFMFLDEARDVEEMFHKAASQSYDVLIIEPLISAGTEENLLRKIQYAVPVMKILVFTSMSENFFAKRMLKCGAKGFLMKTCGEDEFFLAIKTVLNGKTYLSKELIEKFATALNVPKNQLPHEGLSEREFQIFCLMVCGKRSQEISEILSINEKTVSTYKSRVLKKLNVNSLAEVVQYAISQGLIGECTAKCVSHLAQRVS
jgi:two-component system invasion response regulator UvrY